MATDLTKVNSVQQNLLQSIDTLIAKRLDNISYDHTVLCTIVDDTYRKEGKYMVSNGEAKFMAYTEATNYATGNSVYVTIPNGDYDNQKIIIGKKTSDDEQPFNYVAPFDTIFDLTTNLLKDEINRGGLVANGSIKSVCIKPVGYEEDEYVWPVNQAKFDRLGIRADFMSWIPQAVVGNYGLRITVLAQNIGVKKDAVADAESDTSGQPASTSTDSAEEQAFEFEIDCSEMYGNPYNFESYYSQEQVFDISEIGPIRGIKIDFYQKNNFFDQYNQPLPSGTLNDGEIDFAQFDNLFVNNIYICMGYDLGTFDSEYVEIYTNDTTTYNIYKDNQYNLKTIGLRWVHLNGIDRYDMSKTTYEDAGLTKDDAIEVRWYRYSVGAVAADPYCGVYWTRLEEPVDLFIKEINQVKESEKQKTITKEEAEVEIDKLINKYLIQEVSVEDILNSNFDPKELKSNLLGNMEVCGLSPAVWGFYPNGNDQQERIKAILFINGIPYHANKELVFKNENEVPSLSYEIFNNALQITVDDNSNGNYMVYGQDGYLLDDYHTIIDKNGDEVLEYHKIITLGCTFDASGTGDSHQPLNPGDYSRVTWTIPTQGSMMTFKNSSSTGNINEPYSATMAGVRPQFELNSYYSHSNNNNTIIAEYTVNGTTYRTEKEFTFGYAGTFGTAQTVVIDFVGDQKYIDCTKNNWENQSDSFIVQLYDLAGKEITLTENEMTNITWYWVDFENKINKDTVLKIGANKIDLNRKAIKDQQLPILACAIGELVGYFAIPIRLQGEYTHITGATQVIYRADGAPQYSSAYYKLYEGNKQVSNVKWKINQSCGEDSYVAGLTEYSDNNRLNPINMYIEDAYKYGVSAYIGNVEVWRQPILVLQNKWPSSTINAWDGKSLEINDQEGYILSTAIAAGKKDDENAFTGVMIGDWSSKSDSTLSEATGIFGFNNGQTCFTFKDDGTASIGKSSGAQILFNGNKGTIESGSWANNFNMGQGIMIDLDAPFIRARSSKDFNSWKRSSVESLSDKYKAIQVNDYFDVDWDGTIYAMKGKIGNWVINPKGGEIFNKQVGDGTLTSTDNAIVLDPVNKRIDIGPHMRMEGTSSSSNFKIEAAGLDATVSGFSVYGSYDSTYTDTSQLGTLGMIRGNDNVKETENIGIQSTIGHSIVFESMDNLRASATNSLFLDCNAKTSGNAKTYIRLANETFDFGTNTDQKTQIGIKAVNEINTWSETKIGLKAGPHFDTTSTAENNFIAINYNSNPKLVYNDKQLYGSIVMNSKAGEINIGHITDGPYITKLLGHDLLAEYTETVNIYNDNWSIQSRAVSISAGIKQQLTAPGSQEKSKVEMWYNGAYITVGDEVGGSKQGIALTGSGVYVGEELICNSFAQIAGNTTIGTLSNPAEATIYGNLTIEKSNNGYAYTAGKITTHTIAVNHRLYCRYDPSEDIEQNGYGIDFSGVPAENQKGIYARFA